MKIAGSKIMLVLKSIQKFHRLIQSKNSNHEQRQPKIRDKKVENLPKKKNTWIITKHCPVKLVTTRKHHSNLLTRENHQFTFFTTITIPRINPCRRLNYINEIHSST